MLTFLDHPEYYHYHRHYFTGARVSLVVDPPTPGRAVAGTTPAPQRSLLFSMPKAAVAVTAMTDAAPKSTILNAAGNSTFTFLWQRDNYNLK